MADEFKHASVGAELTQAEWEALAAHAADGQTLDDVLYFDGTYWKRIDGEIIPKLYRGKTLLHVPTHAWTASNAGSGSASQAPFFQYVRTGVTAGSRGLLRCSAYMLSPPSYVSYLNWAKKTYLIFNLARAGSDAQVIARFQLKQVATEGALAAKGIGVRVDNLTITGESYGTELGEVAPCGGFGASGDVAQIMIIHYPGSKIEWYFRGTLVGTQSTAAKIPSLETQPYYLVHSIINVDGGTDCLAYVSGIKIWQER